MTHDDLDKLAAFFDRVTSELEFVIIEATSDIEAHDYFTSEYRDDNLLSLFMRLYAANNLSQAIASIQEPLSMLKILPTDERELLDEFLETED